jgi:hypothetical protein
MCFLLLLALHFTHLMLTQSSYSTLVDQGTESVRSRLARIALTAELGALFFINVAFITFGALLYSALRHLGVQADRVQRRTATVGTVFFVALVLRSV